MINIKSAHLTKQRTQNRTHTSDDIFFVNLCFQYTPNSYNAFICENLTKNSARIDILY